ncbi:hypothetical protein Hypma_003788 [Hypsizygus marmoreus]|uniref:F-box domain-containing protein n=1 Tax=Hypsizygus marmoreus TaxID=39966 RepID=A0A369K9E5_HYPMA|nr:hypothetical protein Hypma_003788 [Hypsizygus marmoreus]
MQSNSVTFSTLNYDILHAICDELIYLYSYQRSFVCRPPCLLPLSMTCRRIRELLAPSIFREVRNRRRLLCNTDDYPDNTVWPRNIWKHIELVVLENEGKYSMDIVTVASMIPQLPRLKQVRFEMDVAPPEVLLHATAIAGIRSLVFTKIRLDGPPLTDVFSKSKLTNLLLTVGPYRPRNLDAPCELDHVAGILSILSKTLIYLKISGDLVSFKTLADLDWPCLRTLTLIDHVPYGQVMPLPLVISHMPLLLNLHYNFGATSLGRIPPIVFWFENQDFASLANTHPCLKSLSMSNVYPPEHTLDELPEGLRSLRILALREQNRETLRGPWYPFSPLREDDAFRILANASLLPNLIDLALTLEDLPSPVLLKAVTEACPRLCNLEISQGLFERKQVESPYSTESLAEPLIRLRFLCDLRISIGFGKQYTGSVFYGLRDKTPLLLRMEAAAQVFACKLTHLNSVSFSFENDGLYAGLRELVIWYRYRITNGGDGKPLIVKPDIETMYQASSEPGPKICGFV